MTRPSRGGAFARRRKFAMEPQRMAAASGLTSNVLVLQVTAMLLRLCVQSVGL